jgi:hypothetical protein
MGIEQSPLVAAMKLAQQPRRNVGKTNRIALAWMTTNKGISLSVGARSTRLQCVTALSGGAAHLGAGVFRREATHAGNARPSASTDVGNSVGKIRIS